MKLTIRHDDYDFRLSTDEYIEVHEMFVKAEVVETIGIQPAHFERLGHIPDGLSEYLKSTTYLDIQLHGWDHVEYDKMTFTEIVRDLLAGKEFCRMHFDAVPTVFYPPWNRMSEGMVQAAEYCHMTLDNESNDINKFIREAKEGMFLGNSLYFHAWNKDELRQVPEMLELVNQYANASR